MQNAKEGNGRHWMLLTVVALALFLDGLDGTIVSVVLPDIAQSFGTSTGTASWVVTTYFLMMAGLILIFGKIADGGAIKRLFIGGLLTFAFSSLACGLSLGFGMLLVFRAVQGVGAAMMATTAFMLCVKYLPRRMAAFALSVGVLGTSLGAAAGPALGGVLTELMSWHLVFFINVPIGIVAALIAMHSIPKDTGFNPSSFDMRGAVLLFVAMICGLYVLESTPSHGFDGFSAILLSIFAVCFASFLYIETKVSDPILKLRLFRLPKLVATIVALILVNVVYMGCLYLLPFYLQLEMGLDTMGTGMYLLIPAVSTLVFCLWVGKAADRIGNRPFVVAGCLCMMVGVVMFRVMGMDGGTLLYIGLFLLGATWGLAGGPIGSRMLEFVPDADRPSASTLMSFFIYFGCALGTSLFAGLFGLGSGAGSASISDLDPEVFAQGFLFCMTAAIVMTTTAFVLSCAAKRSDGDA